MYKGTDLQPHLRCVLRGKWNATRQTTLLLVQPPVGPSPARLQRQVLALSSSCTSPRPQILEMPYEGAGSEDRQVPSSLPVTRSSAVLVACPDPLVALREYRPLLALVTAGIVSLARPSLKEICTPGRVEVEITWPSRNQLTSGTGKPGAQRQFPFTFERGTAKASALPRCVHCLVLTGKSSPEGNAM